jgi:hypothetical protein
MKTYKCVYDNIEWLMVFVTDRVLCGINDNTALQIIPRIRRWMTYA